MVGKLKKRVVKRPANDKTMIGFSFMDFADSDVRPKDELLTISQAAQLRGTSRIAVHELINRGRLEAIEIAGRKFVRRVDLERFEREKPGPKLTD